MVSGRGIIPERIGKEDGHFHVRISEATHGKQAGKEKEAFKKGLSHLGEMTGVDVNKDEVEQFV